MRSIPFSARRLLPALMLPALLPLAIDPSLRAAPQAQTKVFRAGAATSNITPTLDSSIIGGWNPPPAAHVHDELFARCLVLDDGSTRLAIVVCDNVAIPRKVYDRAKRMIFEKTGLPVENMLMSATHTHSATTARGTLDSRGFQGIVSTFPSTGDPASGLDGYQLFVATRIADGVRRAINNLQPAKIGWGAGSVPDEVSNRRWFMKPGFPLPDPFGGTDKVLMNPRPGDPNILKPAGPTDPQVPFLLIRSAAGRPLALLANYSLHYVGGVPSNHISADYYGVFARKIEELLDAEHQEPPFVGILSNGTSGDVNNTDFTGKRPRRAPYEQMTLVAGKVAAEVARVASTIECRDWVPVRMLQKEIRLGVRHPSPEALARAERIVGDPAKASKYTSREASYAQRLIDISTKYPKEVDIILQTLQVGDVGIASIPAEVFVEIGLEIKAKSPFRPSFVIELANDQWVYLPTPRQHELGGYETWMGTNLLEVQAAPKIVGTLLDMFAQLRAQHSE